MTQHLFTKRTSIFLTMSSLLAVFVSSCGLLSQDQITPPPPGDIPTATPAPMAETVFDVSLPAPVPDGASLTLAVLDEVTGLPVNPVYYPLQAVDATHYTTRLALPLSGAVKYRYVLQGAYPVQEDTAFEKPVRYRMYVVPGPGQVADVISSWTDQPFSGSVGRIQGQVVDPSNGAPLPDILVTAGGVTTMTDSMGTFILEGLPPGTHNLVAYSLDGAYQPFQQGATVAAGATTPAAVPMKPARKVKITFVVNVPADTVAGAPLRIAGNIRQLGNTFGDLDGGLSTMASQMPLLTPLPDGRYTATIELPAGTDLQYKYTQGDGLWNAEHATDGSFRVRQLIVPDQNSIVQDQVDTWLAGTNAPILFEVSVPPGTPAGDIVSIQFNPYAWTVPIPMWPVGNNQWVFKVFSPLGMVNSLSYRYCRNDQCGSADDSATAGQVNPGRVVNVSQTYLEIKDTVASWQWEPVPSSIGAQPIVNKRPQGFYTGVELQPSFHPSWSPFFPNAFLSLKAIHADWAVLSPTWSVSRNSPLVFSQIPGLNGLRSDVESQVSSAKALNLNVALFPNPRFETQADDWRYSAPEDWNAWFDRYRAFALYNADIAAASNAQALILGGEWIPPALFDGSPDADSRFRGLITELRQHFGGQIWWGQPYPGSMQASPSFFDALDGIYLLWSAPLSQNPTASIDEMAIEAGRRLDSDILPFAISIQKPVIVAPVYPSAGGAISGCVPAPAGGCVDWAALSRPMPDIPSVALDLQSQANAYQALLTAVNDRPWLSGFVSRGYYPPVALADKSASVNGKPAADIIAFWFAQMLGLDQ
jgi:Carboxypeptidase regulatory-like domain